MIFIEEKKCYSYFGVVKSFGTIICNEWEAETYATSVKKALNNFSYRYKKEHGLTPDSKIELPGKITEV